VCGTSTRFRVLASTFGALQWHWLVTPQSVGLLRTSDQPDAETYTWQRTTLRRDIHFPGVIRTHIPSKRTAARSAPCTARQLKSANSKATCSINNQHMHWIIPLLYSIYRLLHVSAVVCHHQGASWIRLSYLKCRSAGKHNIRNHNTPTHRPYKHTLYDTPLIWNVFQVTQTDPGSSLMMADYCRNM
jgi:hypothetical protein